MDSIELEGVGHSTSHAPLNCDALCRSMDTVRPLRLRGGNSEFVGDFPLTWQEAGEPGNSPNKGN